MKPINPFLIMRAVENYFHLENGSLIKRDRKPYITRARNIGMYLVREVCGFTYNEIAAFFDRDDHKTIMNGCKKALKHSEHIKNILGDINAYRYDRQNIVN